MEDFSFYSYSTACISYILLLIYSLKYLSNNPRRTAFNFALIFSLLWSIFAVYHLYSGNYVLDKLMPIEVLKNSTWYYYLLIILAGLRYIEAKTILRSSSVYALSSFLLLTFIIELTPSILLFLNELLGIDFRLLAHVALSIIGLLLVEQVYRNAIFEQRWAIKFTCLGLGCLFSYDLLLYSKALLFQQIDFLLWDARGIINAISAPLLLFSALRIQNLFNHPHQDSPKNINKILSSSSQMSGRKLVFYSVTLLLTGLYLSTMAVTGMFIKQSHSQWGNSAQIIFIFLAILMFFLLMSSGKIRALFITHFSKYFFRYHYNYRIEWLKISEAVGKLSSTSDVSLFIIRTLSKLIGSSGGGIWIKNENKLFILSESYNLNFKAPQRIHPKTAMIQFFETSHQVIDRIEYEYNPMTYNEIDLLSWLDKEKKVWLIIPLYQYDKLHAFVVLTQPQVKRQLNWEDHDLLKTVGMQLSNALLLQQASEQVAIAKQFEAYNRLSAFVVHDLKNVIAQVSLITQNAKLYKDDPEFIDDSLETLDNVTFKMQNLMGQLKKGDVKIKTVLFDMVPLLKNVVEQQCAYHPQPQIHGLDVAADFSLKVLGEEQRMSAIIAHLIQNAQDATSNDGLVDVDISYNKSQITVIIIDTGIGMDDKFIAERLFKPFDTTKGNAGMGIGVYEANEYIQSIGGKIDVQSTLNQGTTFTVSLPLSPQSK